MAEFYCVNMSKLQIDETSTFEASERRNAVFYKVEINGKVYWIDTNIPMTRSSLTRELSKKYEHFYILKESIAKPLKSISLYEVMRRRL